MKYKFNWLNFCILFLLVIVLGNYFFHKSYISYLFDKETYLVNLDKFNINNDNTNPQSTTLGINSAIKYAKENNYKVVKIPKGHYAIDTSVTDSITLKDNNNKEWTHNRQGIVMQSNITLDLTDCILEMVPVEDPYYTILTISNCENANVFGGTIIGDRYDHDYGIRINDSGNELEIGGFDEFGKEVNNDTQVRTKNFIELYSNSKVSFEKLYIIPLWNTSKNTVDGGCRYIYCYDDNNIYLGMSEGGSGFIKQATLPKGTKKIKVSFKDETRLDAVYSITPREIYATYEFGTGIRITDSNNIEIKGVTIKDVIGDCIGTFAPPINVTVNNLKIIDCTLENSRRQGISFVASGENYLVKSCNIGNINGTDPQCGIDFEHYGYVKNTVIDGCNFYDNKKWDIINYNGTKIEIKNSTFTGAIASTYGHTMDIHDNIFEYRDRPNNDKIFKNRSINLGTENNKVYNNKFKNGGVSNSGDNSNTYNNNFYNCFVNITSNDKNNYYNCEVAIMQNDNLPILENNYFENCNVFNYYDSPKIEVSKSIFKNSSFNARGETLISNSTFDMKTKSIIDGWKTEKTNITYLNCSINSNYRKNIQLLGQNLNTNVLFKNCNFNISRYTLALNYGNILFDRCIFNFNSLNNDSNAVDLNHSGYGFKNSPWSFNNCEFYSNLPIKIYGGNVINPTLNKYIEVIE